MCKYNKSFITRALFNSEWIEGVYTSIKSTKKKMKSIRQCKSKITIQHHATGLYFSSADKKQLPTQTVPAETWRLLNVA